MSEKIWLQHYPPEVPAEINPQAYTSLVDLFEQSCNKFKELPAVSSMGSKMSFNQLEKLSRYFAAYLQHSLKLSKGERIAIMLPNSMQYYLVMFAALRVGLVLVNMNPQYTHYELNQQLLDSQAIVLVSLANFSHTLVKISSPSLKHIIVTELGDLFPFPKSWLLNRLIRYKKPINSGDNLLNSIKLTEILSQGKRLVFQPVEVNNKDIAFLQYTGGTTGIPKGAVLTHGSMVANIEQSCAWIKGSGLREGMETILTPLPLYHIFSLMTCALCFIKLGGWLY